jgi:CRISPR-associated protein Cas5d
MYGVCRALQLCEGVSYYQGTEIPYGFMYHGITYADEAEREEDKGKLTVRFWRPVMKDGVIKFDHPNDIPESQKRHIRDMKIKPFGKDLDNFSGLEEFDFIGGGDNIELD